MGAPVFARRLDELGELVAALLDQTQWPWQLNFKAKIGRRIQGADVDQCEASEIQPFRSDKKVRRGKRQPVHAPIGLVATKIGLALGLESPLHGRQIIK